MSSHDDYSGWFFVGLVILVVAYFGGMYMETARPTCIFAANGTIMNTEPGMCLPANTRALSMAFPTAIFAAIVFFIIGEYFLIKKAKQDTTMNFNGFLAWNILVIILAVVASPVYNLIQIYVRTAAIGVIDWAKTIDWIRTCGIIFGVMVVVGGFWMFKRILWNLFVVPARELVGNYERRCKRCGNTFTTNQPKSTICGKCLWAKK
jgi:ribosomal protein S27AE